VKTTLTTTKNAILLAIIAFVTIFFTACNNEQPQATVKVEPQTAAVEVTAKEEVVKQPEIQIDLYNPNLDSIFATVSTAEAKEQLWLNVSNIAEKNWLSLSNKYEKRWLAISDSLEKIWLKKNDEALKQFKLNDPVTYQQYLTAQKRKLRAVACFFRKKYFERIQEVSAIKWASLL
jgi:hypothetical protein